MKKNLIAYFSCSGVTRQAAQRLAEVIGGELFEIQPEQVQSVPAEDLP